MSSLDRIDIPPSVQAAARAVIGDGKGIKIETASTWHGEPALRITSAPRGRGIPRDKYLIVAPTLSDAFRALAQLTLGLEEK